jgi:hypothetical protein
MSEDDVSARDALAIAQRSLARLQEIENELHGELEETNETVDQLQDDLTALELRVSELDENRDPADLSADEKVGMVREHGFRKATEGHGRAKLDYDDIKWEIFGGDIGDSTCYRLIRKAAGLSDEKTGSAIDGFAARNPAGDNYHLAIDAQEAKRSRVFSAGKIGVTEEVR